MIESLESIKRNAVRKLLNQCTTDQINKFNRMYGSIDSISDEDLDRAYNQCRRTLRKNKD